MDSKLRERYRCPICGQYPKVDQQGALRRHNYPWYHAQDGQTCSGSGSQVLALPGQLDLLEEEPH